MLVTLMIIAIICWIATFFIKGITLYTIILVIPTICFCARKVGYHMKFTTLCVQEGLFLFFSIMWQALFGSMDILRTILCIICRLVFICVVLYDDKVYVYVNEEITK